MADEVKHRVHVKLAGDVPQVSWQLYGNGAAGQSADAGPTAVRWAAVPTLVAPQPQSVAGQQQASICRSRDSFFFIAAWWCLDICPGYC